MGIDITERKRAEEKLRKVNEELDNFVNVVSHNLKISIISIQGFSSRLLQDYQKKLGYESKITLSGSGILPTRWNYWSLISLRCQRSAG